MFAYSFAKFLCLFDQEPSAASLLHLCLPGPARLLLQFRLLIMANISAFRALRYNPARVSFPTVVTQPYDKISPAMQEHYYESSPYNLVRIILGKRNPTDRPSDNPYTRAAAFLGDWRRDGILLQDAEPRFTSIP